VEFCDSYLLLPSSLKGLCGLFKTKENSSVEKLEFNHDQVNAQNFASSEIRTAVEKYLWADVASLHAVLHSAQKAFADKG